MIELTYFLEKRSAGSAYQVIQFNPGEPWQIVEGDELIGTVEKLYGFWNLHCHSEVPEGLLTGIGKLIDNQNFHKLPTQMKLRWADELLEVIGQSDTQYLVICKAEIDFERFEKVFRAFIGQLVKDEWQVCFRVYNADMSDDFQVIVN